MASRPPPARENIWLSLLCNVGLPVLVLTKLSSEKAWLGFPGFGPVGGLLVAVSFPLGYGLYDLVRRRKWNLLSIIGLVSVLLTGGLGLLQFAPFWFAVKEAAVPAVIGLCVIGSLRTPYPLVKTILFNPQVIDTGRVEAALEARGTRPDFERLLTSSTGLLAGSFFLSAVLNFFLARWIIDATPGTAEFNDQLGRLTALSFPVIALPSMAIMVFALFRLLGGVSRLTGLTTDEVLHQPPPKAK